MWVWKTVEGVEMLRMLGRVTCGCTAPIPSPSPAHLPSPPPLPHTQVVDARDPLLYRSKDLEAHAREVHASKSSFILLNKSDLLPPHVRAAWADYFDEVRVRGQADEEGAGRGAGR